MLGRVAGHGAPLKALQKLLGAYLLGLGQGKAQVALRLVSPEECRRLNRDYRGQDKATDILSFPGHEGRAPQGMEGHIGDLALCLPYAWKKRGRFDPDFGAECAFLLLHGLLHLNGQHHDSPAQEQVMWRLSRRLHPLGKAHFKALRALGPRTGKK
ncbi:MAG: rRNA maturation RNase YbeY [Desulfobaccales bacterium]